MITNFWGKYYIKTCFFFFMPCGFHNVGRCCLSFFYTNKSSIVICDCATAECSSNNFIHRNNMFFIYTIMKISICNSVDNFNFLLLYHKIYTNSPWGVLSWSFICYFLSFSDYLFLGFTYFFTLWKMIIHKLSYYAHAKRLVYALL